LLLADKSEREGDKERERGERERDRGRRRERKRALALLSEASDIDFPSVYLRSFSAKKLRLVAHPPTADIDAAGLSRELDRTPYVPRILCT
jgi:hypothetical protein